MRTLIGNKWSPRDTFRYRVTPPLWASLGITGLPVAINEGEGGFRHIDKQVQCGLTTSFAWNCSLEAEATMLETECVESGSRPPRPAKEDMHSHSLSERKLIYPLQNPPCRVARAQHETNRLFRESEERGMAVDKEELM